MTISKGGEDENPPNTFAENDMSLGKIPPKSERLKDSEGLQISKLCGESDWQPRFLVITSDRIVIAHPGQDEISDQIPLVTFTFMPRILFPTHTPSCSTKFLDLTNLLVMARM